MAHIIYSDEMLERSWQRDFTHENGNYINTCIRCESPFAGHKRRVICAKCAKPLPWYKQKRTIHLWGTLCAEVRIWKPSIEFTHLPF